MKRMILFSVVILSLLQSVKASFTTDLTDAFKQTSSFAVALPTVPLLVGSGIAGLLCMQEPTTNDKVLFGYWSLGLLVAASASHGLSNKIANSASNEQSQNAAHSCKEAGFFVGGLASGVLAVCYHLDSYSHINKNFYTIH